ncbi:MAG: hypothetical protein DCC68_17425 [Planctomycetota bacterium]|nr:MAG: hypothetical protein DCC68_17425 [Planctomycetota bacterium]
MEADSAMVNWEDGEVGIGPALQNTRQRRCWEAFLAARPSFSPEKCRYSRDFAAISQPKLS